MFLLRMLTEYIKNNAERACERRHARKVHNITLIRDNFDYLIHEYGFTIVKVESETYYRVIYERSWLQVIVVFEFPETGLYIDIVDRSGKRLSLNEILCARQPSVKLKNLPAFFESLSAYLSNILPIYAMYLKTYANDMLFTTDRNTFVDIYNSIKCKKSS